jgi:hypothetical protein
MTESAEHCALHRHLLRWQCLPRVPAAREADSNLSRKQQENPFLSHAHVV